MSDDLSGLLAGVRKQLHDEDPAEFHGSGGPGDCPDCAEPQNVSGDDL